MAKGRFVLRGGFPAGTSVGIYERVGDTFSQALTKKKTARVPKDMVLEVEGLEEGPYFVAALVKDDVTGEENMRVRAVTVKPAELVSAQAALRAPKRRADGSAVPNPIADPELSPSLRSQREDPEIVTGVRTTRVRGHVPPSDRLALEHDPKGDGAREDGIPALGSKAEPEQLASDTFAGQAHAATPPGGRLQQDEVPAGTPQASDTELGDAAIIVDVKEPELGDHDPNRASGDSAVGPAGTVGPGNLVRAKGGEMVAPPSTSRVERDAERRARRKSPNAKRRPSRAEQERRVRRAKEREAAKRAEEAPGDLTPGTNPLAGEPPAPEVEKPAPNRGARSTSRAAPATTKSGKKRKSGAKKAVQRDAQKQATAKSRGRS